MLPFAASELILSYHSTECMEILEMMTDALESTMHSYVCGIKTRPERLKKINKCFSGHNFEKQMRQAGFYFIFYFPKNR